MVSNLNKMQQLQDRELNNKNIHINEFEFDNIKAVAIKQDDDYFIGLEKRLDEADKFFKLEHELTHIYERLLYASDSSDFIVNQTEREVNDRLLLKTTLATAVLDLQCKGLNKQKIMKKLDIPEYIYDHANKLIKRKALEIMENMLSLISLKNNIETVGELAEILDIDVDLAYEYLLETREISEEDVEKICNTFNVSREYLLCK